MTYTIAALGDDLTDALQQKIDAKTKPAGALGRLEKLALQIGRIQQTLTPALRDPHIVVFAGDHGAALAGVSAYPQNVTWQMVENFLAGGAAINVFARQAGLALRIVDAGVAHDFGAREGLVDAKIAPGTQNFLEAPAMSAAQRDEALARGRAIAHELADGGCNALGFGEMGIGSTAAASLLTHCLTGAPLALVVGRGSGLDDLGLSHKQMVLSKALARGGCPRDALSTLAEYGGFEIAMLTGAILGAAERRMVLVIDGFIVTAALLVAHALAPKVIDYCVFAHSSQERGHSHQLGWLSVMPLLNLGMRLGEGTGAALAWPLLNAATAFVGEMASFESAGVSRRMG